MDGWIETTYEFDKMTRQDLVAALKNELADVGTLCDQLTTIYEWASGGVISKPMTKVEEVIELGEARINREVEKAEEEGAMQERGRVKEVLARLYKDYDRLYLRACEGGSPIGAAQAAGRQMAVADIRGGLFGG